MVNKSEFQTENKINPVVLFVTVLIGILLSLFSLDPLLVFISVIFLPIIYFFTFRDNEPQVIFIALILYYFSISIKLFYAMFFGNSFVEYSESSLIEATTYLAYVAMFFFMLGIYISTKKIKFSKNNNISTTLLQYNPRRIVTIYIVSLIVSSFIRTVSSSWGGFYQFAINFAYLHYGILFILISYAYYTNRNVRITIILVLFEIVLSFSGFFSGFKDYLLIIIASVLAFKIQLNFRQTILLAILSTITIYTIIIWTAVKPEYRKFLSGGERSQQVVVDKSAALEKLGELVLDFSSESYNFEEIYYFLVDRISYTEFFSLSTEQVPQYIPHENGKLLISAIDHVITPRILNPNKKAIYDSEMVNKYSGRAVSGEAEGTSFSLGILAELYIDFGPYLMHLFTFLLGLLMGFIYKYIIMNSLNKLWGSALVMQLLFLFNCNGTPSKKVFGYLFMYFIVYLVFRFTLLKRIDKYLRGSFLDKL